MDMLNRGLQLVEEKVGMVDKTEFDDEFKELEIKVAKIKQLTERMVDQAYIYVQPSPTARMEDRMNEGLDMLKLLRDKQKNVSVEEKQIEENAVAEDEEAAAAAPSVVAESEDPVEEKRSAARTRPENNQEEFGKTLLGCSMRFSPASGTRTLMHDVGTAQIRLGLSDQQLLYAVSINFILPLKEYLNTNIAKYEHERDALETKRLDFDSINNRFKKMKNSGGSDPVMERNCDNKKQNFEKQLLLVTQMMQDIVEGTEKIHDKALRGLVKAQRQHYDDAVKMLEVDLGEDDGDE